VAVTMNVHVPNYDGRLVCKLQVHGLGRGLRYLRQLTS
jgi:hypothetical protein